MPSKNMNDCKFIHVFSLFILLLSLLRFFSMAVRYLFSFIVVFLNRIEHCAPQGGCVYSLSIKHLHLMITYIFCE